MQPSNGYAGPLREPLRVALETIAAQAKVIATLRAELVEANICVDELQKLIGRLA